MWTFLIILYFVIGIILSCKWYMEDIKTKLLYGDYFYVSLLDRIIGVVLWPIVLLVDCEI